jgi:hypothetical protein
MVRSLFSIPIKLRSNLGLYKRTGLFLFKYTGKICGPKGFIKITEM